MRRRHLLWLLLVSVPAPALAADCLPMFCNFSIKGKKGGFLKAQVKPEELVAADARISASLTQGRSLGSISVNRGELSGSGLKMPATETALMALLEKIRLAWPANLRAPPTIKAVRVIGSSSYSPSARPDNVIVVPLGAITRSKNDDDLAWMLAHEYSHIALGHFAREADQKKLVATVASLVDIAHTASDLAQHRIDTSGDQFRVYPRENPKAKAMADSVWAQSRNVNIALEMFDKYLSREQEDAADVAGMDLALVAGFSETAASNALDQVKIDDDNVERAKKSFEAELAGFTETALATSATQMLAGGDMNAIGTNLMKSLGNNFLRIGKTKLISMATATHLPAMKRKKGIGLYVEAAGLVDPAVPEVAVSMAWLDGVRATAEYKEAARTVDAYDCAMRAMVVPPEPAKPPPPPAPPPPDPCWLNGPPPADRLVAAFTALQPAETTRYARTPLVTNAKARIFANQLRYAEAEQAYDVALAAGTAPPPPPPPKAKPARGGKGGKAAAKGGSRIIVLPPEPEVVDPLYRQSLEGFQEHVRLLVTVKKYPRGLAVIKEAKARFDDDVAFLPELVTIYARTRQQESLFASLGRCQLSEDKNLAQRCNIALLDDQTQLAFNAADPETRAKFEMELAKATEQTRRLVPANGNAGASQ